MEVQTKAFELALYTIENSLKEKIVPKRDRWSLGEALKEHALEIASQLDMANTMRLDDEEEARERRLAQRKALSATFKLATLIHITRNLTHFDEKVHEHWTKLVKEEQELLRNWMDSDRKRRRALN